MKVLRPPTTKEIITEERETASPFFKIFPNFPDKRRDALFAERFGRLASRNPEAGSHPSICAVSPSRPSFATPSSATRFASVFIAVKRRPNSPQPPPIDGKFPATSVRKRRRNTSATSAPIVGKLADNVRNTPATFGSTRLAVFLQSVKKQKNSVPKNGVF